MEDRYTLKHSYVRLPRQESFSKSHRLKPSAPTCYPLYHFWDRLTWEVFPVVVEVWLDMHSGGRAVLGIVGQPYTAVTEEAEGLPF